MRDKIFGQDVDVIEMDTMPCGYDMIFLDMGRIRDRIAILDEPRPMTFTLKTDGDVVHVTARQPAMRFLDRRTGRILT